MAFYKHRKEKKHNKHFIYWRIRDYSKPCPRNQTAFTWKQKSKSFPNKADALRFQANVISQGVEQATAEDVGFYAAGNSFLDSVKALNQPLTWQHYTEGLSKFREYCGSNFPVNQTSPELVGSYINHLTERYAPNTVRGQGKILSAFFSFCIRRNYIPAIVETSNGTRPGNPMGSVDLPKEEKGEGPKIIPPEYIDMLFDDVEESGNLVRHAQLALFYYGGLRRNEVACLEISNINFKRNVLFLVNTKGKKPRAVPMNSDMVEILQRYLESFDHTQSPWAFPTGRSNRGQSSETGHIPKSYGWKVIRWMRKTTGLDYVTIHMLRHSFASAMLREQGGEANLLAVQKLLGHSSPKTTEKYLHLLDGELAKATDTLVRKKKIKT